MSTFALTPNLPGPRIWFNDNLDAETIGTWGRGIVHHARKIQSHRMRSTWNPINLLRTEYKGSRRKREMLTPARTLGWLSVIAAAAAAILI